MRLHMEFECYSADHLLWILYIGLPNIFLWIIGAPMLAFIILFKNRDALENGFIKQYLLILYQGLTKRAYYWEFLNTLRKILILSVYMILSFTSVASRAVICLIILLFMFRMQRRLKPYKLSINNELEMKAISVGTLTLY